MSTVNETRNLSQEGYAQRERETSDASAPDISLGRMLAALSHECRNALQRVQSCLSMLALEVRDQPSAMRLVERSQRAQHDLCRLFDDIRDYSAPINLDVQACDLRRLWRSAWKELAPAYPKHTVNFSEPSDAIDLRCRADTARLAQVFRRIFENSLAACTDSVEITIACEAVDFADRPALQVAIGDNGSGLSLEQQERIFEPFYSAKQHGMGLGMAIAKRFIEAHGGRIEARVANCGGAEIVITLPRGKP